VSEPQLRCLLCDLLLADENARDQPSETCKQCGRKVLAGQGGDDVELQPLNPPPRPKPLDLDLDLLPEAAVVPPTPSAPPPPATPADDIPSVPVLDKARRVEADVPTVQPRGKTTSTPASVPYAAKRVNEAPTARTGPAFPPPPPATRPAGKTIPQFPGKKVTLPDPSRVPSTTPRPKVLQAFAILGCMTLMAIAAIVVIISCIVIGLMKASKLG
jgi:hypothetical protein